jgi:hypothetical protein
MRRAGKKAWPTKRTLNLVIKEKNLSSPSRSIPLLAAILVAAALFSKFAVADRLAMVNAAQRRVDQAQTALQQLRASYADYDQVSAEFHRYSYGAFTPEEMELVERLQVLNLLEDYVMSAAQVKTLALSGNTLSLTLAGLSLERASTLVASLKSSPIVADVAVYTVGYGADSRVGTQTSLLTMTITLARPVQGGAS